MILDKNLLMCDQQTLVFTAAAVLSERSIPIQAAQAIPLEGTGTGGPHDLGTGTPIDVVVEITEQCTSASSDGTLKAELVMADDEALTSNLTVLQVTPTYVVTALVPGKQLPLGGTLPPGTTKGFIGVRLTTAVHDFTAGKVSAWLGPQGHRQSTFV